MYIRPLLLAISVGCLCSCSSTRKSQTTDDVYYSSGKTDNASSQSSDGGYIANDGTDSRVQSTTSTTTADNYNEYAYGDGYSPYSTFISPYYGGAWGMGPYGYSPYSMYGGLYASEFGYGYGFGMGLNYGMYPTYYGGYYNPYYPGYGYYTKAYIGGGGLAYGPGQVSVLAYNNNHFNNINSTVPTTRSISGGTVVNNSNRFTSMLNGKPANHITAQSGNRQGVNTRTQNVNNSSNRTYYRNSTNTTNGSSSLRGGGGGSFGGGRVGGGGFGGGGGRGGRG
jgi:hypothetical protein